MKENYDIIIKNNSVEKEFIMEFWLNNENAITACIEANCFQDAMDALADYLTETEEYPFLYTDDYEIMDNLENDDDFDKYIYENDLISCGESGIYIMPPSNIEEKEKRNV